MMYDHRGRFYRVYILLILLFVLFERYNLPKFVLFKFFTGHILILYLFKLYQV